MTTSPERTMMARVAPSSQDNFSYQLPLPDVRTVPRLLYRNRQTVQVRADDSAH
jgi:hypothetical protein